MGARLMTMQQSGAASLNLLVSRPSGTDRSHQAVNRALIDPSGQTRAGRAGTAAKNVCGRSPGVSQRAVRRRCGRTAGVVGRTGLAADIPRGAWWCVPAPPAGQTRPEGTCKPLSKDSTVRGLLGHRRSRTVPIHVHAGREQRALAAQWAVGRYHPDRAGRPRAQSQLRRVLHQFPLFSTGSSGGQPRPFPHCDASTTITARTPGRHVPAAPGAMPPLPLFGPVPPTIGSNRPSLPRRSSR